MNSTDKLRAMLDERGVRWWEEDGHTLWYGESIHHAASAFSSFLFGENERVHLNAMVTPAQAVEATLGRGTCHMVLAELRGPAYTDIYECSECGEEVMVSTVMGESKPPHYCPNCGRKIDGRKVVEE